MIPRSQIAPEEGKRRMSADVDIKKNPSFISVATCEHLKNFFSRESPNYITTEKFSDLDCHAQRDALQKTFSEAYLSLITMVETGEEAAEEEKANCYGVAYDRDDSRRAKKPQKRRRQIVTVSRTTG